MSPLNFEFRCLSCVNLPHFAQSIFLTFLLELCCTKGIVSSSGSFPRAAQFVLRCFAQQRRHVAEAVAYEPGDLEPATAARLARSGRGTAFANTAIASFSGRCTMASMSNVVGSRRSLIAISQMPAAMVERLVDLVEARADVIIEQRISRGGDENARRRDAWDEVR